MTEKEYTIKNLQADRACDAGMNFVTPLIKSGEFTPEKLLAKNKHWLMWAVVRGYGGRELVAKDFGPQMDHVIDLIQRAMTLTIDEVNRLDTGWRAILNTDRYAAVDSARYVVRYAERNSAWYTAWNAIWYPDRYVDIGAVSALFVRDLIGQYRFTQGHYDILTGPWRRVIGRIHPDDDNLQ